MLRPDRGMPRELTQRRHELRSIARVLSAVPRLEPDITIEPIEGEGFGVRLEECPGLPVALHVGEEGVYADYDALDRQFREATFLRVSRRVKLLGTWCLEIEETGGVNAEGGFDICWHGPMYCRVTDQHVRQIDPLDPSDRRKQAREIPPEPAVSLGDSAISGPLDAGLQFAGNAAVSIGDARFDCARLVTAHRSGERPESIRVSDLYISRSGRTVLLREYRSLGDYAETMDRLKALHSDVTRLTDWNEDWPSGRPALTSNGIECRHWFDTLTNIALRLLPERGTRNGKRR